MLYHKKAKLFISIFFLFFLTVVHTPCFSMDEDDLVLSRPVYPSSSAHFQRDEESPLIQDAPITLLQGAPTNQHVRALNRILGRTQTFETALVAYPQNYQFQQRVLLDDTDHSQISLDVLHHFDETFFNDGNVPRSLVRCCNPLVLDLTQVVFGLGGAAAIALSMGPFSNGDLGDLFNYPVGGTVSNAVFGSAVTLNAPPAIIIFYGLGKGALQKSRSFFLPASSEEAEGNGHFARAFKKTRGHKFMEYVLVGAGAVYGLQPALAFILEEKFFPYYGIPMSVPLLVYFATPFVQTGKKIVHRWYANNFYIGGHNSKELRRAFVTHIGNIKRAVEQDTEGALTNKLWEILHAGGVSPLSALMAKALVIDLSNVQSAHYNRTVLTAPIVEKTRGEEIASFLATFLVGAAAIPGYMTEAWLVTNALTSGYGPSADSPANHLVSPKIAGPIGYGFSGLFQTRLPIEREMHRQNFASLFSHPITPEDQDHIGIRRAFGVKSYLYAAFGGILYGAFTYQALEGMPSPAREIMTAVAALRYFSYFFYMGSYEYNKVVTHTSKRFKTDPGLQNKKAQINDYIKRAKETIMYELEDETITEMARAIYNTQ